MSESKRSGPIAEKHEQRRRELIGALKELAKRVGPDVTLQQFAKSLGRSKRYVVEYFDSWADLREAAGLPRKRRAGYSRETLIAALQQAEREYGQPVSRRRFYLLTGISPATCDRQFGSWCEFRTAAGLEGVATPGVARKYTREDLLRMMREQIPILGGTMTRNQFAKATGVSTCTIDRLGNWGKLRLELGLSARGNAEAKEFLDALGIELCDDLNLLIGFPDDDARPNVD